MVAVRVNHHGFHDAREQLAVQEGLVVLGTVAPEACVNAQGPLVAEVPVHADGVGLLRVGIIAAVFYNDAGILPAAVAPGELLALPVGGQGGRFAAGRAEVDAAGKLLRVEGGDKAVLAGQNLPAGREGEGDAAGGQGLTVGGGDDLEVIQDGPDMPEVQQLIDVGVLRGVLGVQTDVHAVPGSGQGLAVVHHYVHRGLVRLVFGIEPALPGVVGPDSGGESGQGGGHIPGPVLLDGVAVINQGGVDVVDEIIAPDIRLEPQDPFPLVVGDVDVGEVLGPLLLPDGDALGKVQDQVRVGKGLGRQGQGPGVSRDGVRIVQSVGGRLLLHKGGLLRRRFLTGRLLSGGRRRSGVVAAGGQRNDQAQRQKHGKQSLHIFFSSRRLRLLSLSPWRRRSIRSSRWRRGWR